MNTARIVALTIAVGAGGVAAYFSRGSDSKLSPTEPVAQLRSVDIPGPSEMPARAPQASPPLLAQGGKSPKGRMI
jgi:hypothetical protein